MTTEVTLVIRDPAGRSYSWWWDALEMPVQEDDAEIIDGEDEEV